MHIIINLCNEMQILIITPDNKMDEKELILNLIKDNGYQVSISEISRISGVNRNKVSHIITKLVQDGILNEKREGRSKLYDLKYTPWIISLIEKVIDKAFIINKDLKILYTNSVMNKVMKNTSEYWIGRNLEELSLFSITSEFLVIIDKLINGPDGEQLSIPIKNKEKETATFFKINIGNNLNGILIIIPTSNIEQISIIMEKQQFDICQYFSEYIKNFLNNPVSREEAFTHTIEFIHKLFPDSLSIIAEINPSQQILTISHVGTSEPLWKILNEEYKFSKSIYSKSLLIDPLFLIKFNSQKIFCTDHIASFIIPTKDNNIINFNRKLGLSGAYIGGIYSGLTCIGYLCIAYPITTINHYFYYNILQVIIDILQLYTKIDAEVTHYEMKNNEYKNRFEDLYNEINGLLITNIINTKEIEQLRKILFNVFDNLGILAILCSQQGFFLDSNRHVRNIFNIPPDRELTHLSDIIQGSDLNKILLSMDPNDKFSTFNITKGIPLDGPGIWSRYRWYMLNYFIHDTTPGFIWIAEYEPSNLINSCTNM
jgi:hypothetical protein